MQRYGNASFSLESEMEGNVKNKQNEFIVQTYTATFANWN